MLNHVELQGRLTRDPELRMTQAGTAVASFTLAVDRDVKGQDGQRGVDFLPVVAWKGTAEFVDRNFKKGQMALVTGRIQVRSYTDKDGNQRTVTEIQANDIYFCGGKSEAKPETPAPKPVMVEMDDDDDLPF